jgi:Ca-activated chloride channel family protein
MATAAERSVGGRRFQWQELSEMGDVAAKISDAIREESNPRYRLCDKKRNGKWRKVKVQLEPPRRAASAHGARS